METATGYTSVGGSDDTSDLIVSTDSPFDTLEFEVIGRSGVSEYTVMGKLETESGETITDRRQFRGLAGRWDNHAPESVSMSVDEKLTGATLRLQYKSDPGRAVRNRIRSLQGGPADEVDGPKLGLPALRSQREVNQTPIFLVSVDTFRYDYMDCFKSVLEELGDDAVVPEQPRTHAPETKSVHGSMFTGTYPGDHGYVMRGDREVIRPIDPSLTTLGEILTEQRYKCSGLVSHLNLTADRGFARGFHRYELREMDWEQRRYDARTNVSTCIQWLTEDLRHPDRGLFYFLHLFDAHAPYFPPSPMLTSEKVDQSVIEDLKDLNRSADAPPGCPVNYLSILRNRNNLGKECNLDAIRQWYRESLVYVSDQLERLIREMKSKGIYNDAFIIIIGDHGEEFFERKFALHNTLYDAIIRPGTIIKPPAGTEMSVPNDVDIIDILPTIADLVGAEIPDQCKGTIWDGTTTSHPRIAERVWVDWYSISVETDGIKGIFTFDDDFPNRPTPEKRAAGPVESEFYDVERVQNGDFDQISPDESTRSELLDIALTVMETTGSSTSRQVGKADQNVLDRLEELGYR